MKTYKAYLNQGGGCDYTIGCGQTVINIEANSMEEAIKKLAETIAEEYSHDEGRLESAELYEVEQVIIMNIASIYQEVERIKDEEKQKETSENERQEFERLKAKFG